MIIKILKGDNMAGKPKLQTSLKNNCPAGRDYIFRMPDGREVGRARNLNDFIRMLKIAPLSAILYHTNAGHFSPWLELMGETELAKKFKEIKGNTEQVRRELLNLL
jgi:hypothetical protein